MTDETTKAELAKVELPPNRTVAVTPNRSATERAETRPATGGNEAKVAPAQDSQNVVTDADRVALDRMSLSMRDYRTVMGENPTGTNREITEALNGKNSHQSRLLPEGAALNGNGELVDRWVTPYFFHQLSRESMEIRSAGPDHVLWTDDDLIVR